jgi:hypothetical protein
MTKENLEPVRHSTSPIDEEMAEENEMIPIELSEIANLSSSIRSLNKKRFSISQRSTKSFKYDQDDLYGLRSKFIENENNSESKDSDHSKRLSKQQSTIDNNFKSLKGYAFIILSSFLFSSSHILLKRAKWLTGSDHALIRYSFSLIALFVFIKYKNLDIFPKNSRLTLSLRGIAGNLKLI